MLWQRSFSCSITHSAAPSFSIRQWGQIYGTANILRNSWPAILGWVPYAPFHFRPVSKLIGSIGIPKGVPDSLLPATRRRSIHTEKRMPETTASRNKVTTTAWWPKTLANSASLKPLERPACANHEHSQNHDHCQYLIIAQYRSPPRIVSCHGVSFPHRQPKFVIASFAFINSNMCVCVAGRA
jgi:hypothetical protein